MKSCQLNPWEHLNNERLGEFLSDPKNNEDAPDRKIVNEFIRANFDNPKFLDVGSGTGHHYLSLKKAEIKVQYCGVDKTEKMVEFAKKRFPEAKFIQGDIYKLPFPDRSWDVVYLRHILVHLPGYKGALTEVARVCSGCLIICLLNPLADKQQIKVEGKPPNQTKPENFSEHYLNIYAHTPFMEMLEGILGFNIVVDKLVEVGGFFGRYELITARRRCE